eukprot:3788102-Rhodomonas_salina.3
MSAACSLLVEAQPASEPDVVEQVCRTIRGMLPPPVKEAVVRKRLTLKLEASRARSIPGIKYPEHR